MTVENVQMMWLKTPTRCYNSLTSKIRHVIRTKGAGALAIELSDLCDEYWSLYCEMHDRKDNIQLAIQAWYIWRAIRKILIEYGWWDKERHVPQNWIQEEPS